MSKNKAEVDKPAEISDDELSPQAPKKRREDCGVSLDMLKDLLDRQTRELRDSQRLEMSRAMAQIKQETQTLVRGVEDSVKAQGSDIAAIKTSYVDLEKRLARLESGGTSTQTSSPGLRRVGRKRKENRLALGP